MELNIPLSRLLQVKNRRLALVAVAALFSAGGLMATAPKHETPVNREKVFTVTAVLPEAEYLSPELQLFGRIETPRHTQLSAALESRVLAVHVNEGAAVEAGDLLIALDDEEQSLQLRQRTADLAEARAALEALQTDFASERTILEQQQALLDLTHSRVQRLQTLHARQLVATEQLETLQREAATQQIEFARQQGLVAKQPQRLASARARLESAAAREQDQQRSLQQTRVRAPFAGRVARVAAAPGDRVRPGQTLLALYDDRALQLRVPVPGSVAGTLKRALVAGDAIEAFVGEQEMPARLLQLASEVGSGSTGLEAIFTLPESAGASHELGRAVDLFLRLPASGPAVALPLQSLYGQKRIYLVENSRLRALEVITLGSRRNALGELEVLVDASAIPANTRVLTSDLPQASSGLAVEVVGAAAIAGTEGNMGRAGSPPANKA
ncbi:MAG: efflux RND transporter periplasmic adaptor subunit [Haliea sp.]